MKVIRAKTAGFCKGVSLALEKLENAITTFAQDRQKCRRICTLGPIIHNPQVLANFEALGVVCLDNASLAQDGDFILIRAHGITRQEENILRNKCASVKDATCPKVKRAQLAIAKATADGASLLLFGEAEHPEVRGLVSYAANGSVVFSSLAEMEKLQLDATAPYVLAAQTTQDREIFAEISKKLQDNLPNLKILSTICDATKQRQEEALHIASEVDCMVIVGGRQSGNTRRLASLARQSGVTAFHVETIEELNVENFANMTTVGLTAGASTPENLIDAAENWLVKL